MRNHPAGFPDAPEINLEYIGADGEKHRPIMIHRVAFGSVERFIGILIEHFAGAFPTLAGSGTGKGSFPSLRSMRNTQSP